MSAVDESSDEEFTERRKTIGYIRAPFKLYSARRNTSLLTCTISFSPSYYISLQTIIITEELYLNQHVSSR